MVEVAFAGIIHETALVVRAREEPEPMFPYISKSSRSYMKLHYKSA
jgi:hypothetical protein